ncbi:MAG TPA: DUF3275 family protein [Chromatiaceae bacterium]|nr:DUF3275 family protein [Chromatiaceae bacterium]
MITLQGTLTVRTINGRNGPFNVGRLLTEIGEFAVKDPELDQYEEGRYEGNFGINLIYPTSYVAGGRMVMEVRARIGLWSLNDIDDLKPDDQAPIVEPDPLEELPPSGTVPSPKEEGAAEPPSDTVSKKDDTAKPAEDQPQTPTAGIQPEAADKELEALFGELWPLGKEVKLDPTVDRSRFRRQRDHLKAAGYQFRPLDQIWVQSD